MSSLAPPSVELIGIGDLIYIAPKIWILQDKSLRLVIDIRKFKTYPGSKKEYRTKIGIFLYLGQYGKFLSLCEQHCSTFFAINDTQSLLVDFERYDLGYGAYLSQSAETPGKVVITVPSKQRSDRSIEFGETQWKALLAQSEEIEEKISELKAYLEAVEEEAAPVATKDGKKKAEKEAATSTDRKEEEKEPQRKKIKG